MAKRFNTTGEERRRLRHMLRVAINRHKRGGCSRRGHPLHYGSEIELRVEIARIRRLLGEQDMAATAGA